jgi:anti-sigma factor RsiW
MLGMDCRVCREAISARLDGEATERESVAVDVHLGWCAECRAAMERIERVTRLARAYAVGPGPDPARVLLTAWDAAAGDKAAGDEAAPRRSTGCGSNVLRLRALGASECACAAGCACGCQSGRPCRCGHAA